MTGFLNVLWTVFWGVLVLSVLVFVHEGGHYLSARAFRVRATEFFLGMPCRFKLSRKSKSVGTEFGVTPLLFGGYTRICGMEGASDELLAPALALVTRRGRISAQEVSDELHVDLDRAYELLVTLSDWASVQPYYDPEKGESPNQKTYPAAFEAPARDANLLTEYDRGHDFSLEGSTKAGEGRETGMSAEEFLDHERGRTYLGVGFLKRCAMLFAGPLVNIVLAFLIVTLAFMIRGVDYVANVSTISGVTEGTPAAAAGLQAGDVITEVGGELATVDTYHPDFIQAASATLDYTGQVASYVAKLIVPSHTMEVLDQSSSKILIEIIQLIRRKPLSAQAVNFLSYLGIAFILFVFVVVLKNDIGRFIIG